MADDVVNYLAFVITPTIAKKIATLEFFIENKEAIELCMRTFVCNQHSAVERHEIPGVAGLYDCVTSHHASAGLTDAQALLVTDAIALPQMFSNGRGVIKRLMDWFTVCFLKNMMWWRAFRCSSRSG